MTCSGPALSPWGRGQGEGDRAHAEIWITEVARRVEKRKGHVVTEKDAAKALAKIYTMAIAQGIARTQWFEAQDPIGEDQGFGLLARNGTERITYTTYKTLTAHLGPTPKYVGWLALGQGGKGYGFVFQGKSAPVLVAWMSAGQSDKSLVFPGEVKAIDILSGAVTVHQAGQPMNLTDTPVLVADVPEKLVKEAKTNASKNFPWGGDYSTAKTVSCEAGNLDGSHGVFQIRQGATPTVKFADGTTGILSRGDIGQAVSFFVHPSFASLQTKEYYVPRQGEACGTGQRGHESALRSGRKPGTHSLQESRHMVRPDSGHRLADTYLARRRRLLLEDVGLRLQPAAGTVAAVRDRQSRGQHGTVQMTERLVPGLAAV